MKVLVPGHVYQLDTLDGDAHVALPLSSLDNIECWATCAQCGHILCTEGH